MLTYRLAIVALLIGLVGACGRDDTPSSPTPTAPSETTDATATARAAKTVEIEVKDGEVVGGVQRVRLNRGDEIVLVVRSDVADEVHVHGYDERADISAGGTVRIAFTADAPGVFIAELEEHRTRLVSLEIR